MPNYCYNKTTILLKDFDSNSESDVHFIKSLAESAKKDSLLTALCPIDDSSKDPVDFWSVSHIFNTHIIESDNGKLILSYLTPWNSPVNAFDSAVKNNPRLHITNLYSEFGMLFGGEHITDSNGCQLTEISLSTLDDMLADMSESEDSCIDDVYEEFLSTIDCSDALKEHIRTAPVVF